MLQPKSIIHAGLLVLLCTASPLSIAQSDERSGRRGPPPQEALDACSGKKESASCSFTGRNNDQVQGSCLAPPQGGSTLACAPEGGAPRGSGRR